MSHQPREPRGPIETPRRPELLKLTMVCHQPREPRGPIETFPSPFDLAENFDATSRANRAALLKLNFPARNITIASSMPPAARTARPY